jgi:MFS family permease
VICIVDDDKARGERMNRGARLGTDFCRLWAGQAVSAVGTAVTTVALPLVAVVTLDASTLTVGVLTAAQFAAWLFVGLPSGVWVDRTSRRPVMIAADLTRAAALLSVPVAAVWGRLGMGHLVLVALIMSTAGVFFDVAVQTFVPSVLARDDLVTGNSRLQGSESAAQAAGPALGGALVQLLGAPFALLVDMVSYLVSAVSISRIHAREPPPEAGPATAMIPQIRDGLAYVLRHRVLGRITAGTAVLNMLVTAQEALAIVFLVRTVGVGPGLVGVLLAAEGVGGLLGAVISSRLNDRHGGARVLLGAAAVGPVAALLIPMTGPGAGLLLFAAGIAVLAGSTVVFSVLVRSYRQIVCPPQLLGRTTATVRFLTWALVPVGALAGGFLGEWLGVRAALWVIGVGLLAVPVLVAATPLRWMRDLTD